MGNLHIIEKITVRLLQQDPFFACLLSQMRRIEATGKLAETIPTAGVTVRNGRIELYWNPQFFERLTIDEARGVLEHECMHLVRDHIAREGDRDHRLWNIAADLSINQFIQVLPKDCVKLELFPKEWNLHPKDTAENYYDVMMKHANRIHYQDNGDGTTTVTITDSKGNVQSKFTIENPGSHKEWKKGDSPELQKEVIRQAVKESVEQTQRLQGHLPAGLEEDIKVWMQPPVVSWKQLLRKFVAASIKSGSKMSWKRPNRRFGATQKGRLPDRTVAITVVLDTSGSIGQSDYNAFVSEMRAIQACYKGDIRMLECDAEVVKDYKLRKYGKVDTKFKGHGGTDFRPPFKYVIEKSIRTDVLIYFTDMYGTFPEKKPLHPTVWVSTTEIDKAPFGVVISIPKNNPKEK